MESLNHSFVNLNSGSGEYENQTGPMGLEEYEYIFDRPYVQAVFTFLYSVVFCFCFFGNLAVILVLTRHYRKRGITKFCLGNLAFANLCVGIFCVYQNLSTYLMDRWVFGLFMCKMYHFINSLSHTASVLILVVICVERYLAILHPFKCRQIVTFNKLRITIVTVWIVSAILCSPRLYYITTYSIPSPAQPGTEPTTVQICAPQSNLYDNHTADMVYFILLFVFPLTVISVLYTLMGMYLWHSSREPVNVVNLSCSGSQNSEGSNSDASFVESRRVSKYRALSRYTAKKATVDRRQGSKLTSQLETTAGNMPGFNDISCEHMCCVGNNIAKEDGSLEENARSESSTCCESLIALDKNSVQVKLKHIKGTKATTSTRKQLKTSPPSIPALTSYSPNNSCYRRNENAALYPKSCCAGKSSSCEENSMKGARGRKKSSRHCKFPRRSQKLLKRRRSVVRMLIAVVITFAICNLPFHLRKMFQNYMPSYDFGSNFSNLLTPFTFLLMYANCAINPILYAFMSKDFRASLKDLLRC